MSDNQSQTPPPIIATNGSEDKTIAILAYLTIIGFIVALVLNMSKKTRLGAYHLRQTLGFFLTAVAVGVAGFVLLFIPILGHLCLLALWLGMFVLWILGLLSAIQGEMKPMPVVGPLYQKLLGNTFD